MTNASESVYNGDNSFSQDEMSLIRLSCLMQNGTYKPKTNHPWRRYKVRFDEEKPQKTKKNGNGRPLREFLLDMVESWETFTVDSEVSGSVDYRKISSMSDASIAVWLADFIKKHWGQQNYENRILG